MRTRWQMGLAVAVVASLAGLATAQEGRRGMGPGMVLMNPSVQEELKLTDEQKTKLKDEVEKLRDKHRDDFGKLRDMSQQEREDFMKTVQGEVKKAAGGVLDAKQMKRFEQIQRQVMGPRAFTQPDVQKELRLTDDQKTKLKEIAQDMRDKQREIFQGDGDRQEKGQKVRDLRKESEKKMQAVLTDEQKKSWKEMTGEPFEMTREGRGNR